MICWRVKLLHLTNITIFGILLCVATFVAAVCNILVLVIIVRMKNRSISYHILLSLAAADVLVALILGPITIIQVLDIELIENCLAHLIRGYFLVLLVGSSLFTLAVVSYDIYLLLTKLCNYNQYMTKRKATVLIVLSWLFPGLIPIAKHFNMMAYVILRVTIYTLPLIALITFYFLITKEVCNREKNLCHHGTNRFVASNDNSSSYDIPTNQSNDITTAETTIRCERMTSRRQMKHLKLAKSVTLLITCYFACIFPLNIWMILELAKVEYSNLAHQIFYFSAVFLMQVNSCINPIIYYLKQREIKKGFHQIFKGKL